MMKRLVPLAATCLIALSQPALARDSGAYLGAGFADGTLITACTNTTSACNSFSGNAQDSGHLRLIGGYDFNKFVGIEAGWSALGTYKVRDVTASMDVGTVKASAFTLAAKAGYKFASGWSAFGRLGLASVETQYTAGSGVPLTISASQRSTGIIFGLGGQYDFNEKIGIRASRDVVVFSDSGYTGAMGSNNILAIFRF